MYLEFNITPFTLPTRSLDLHNSLSISILDGVPWEEECTVLFDPSYGDARWRLNFDLLETTETAPSNTTIGTNKTNYLLCILTCLNVYQGVCLCFCMSSMPYLLLVVVHNGHGEGTDATTALTDKAAGL